MCAKPLVPTNDTFPELWTCWYLTPVYKKLGEHKSVTIGRDLWVCKPAQRRRCEEAYSCLLGSRATARLRITAGLRFLECRKLDIKWYEDCR